MKNPSSFDIGTQRCDFVSTCRKSVSQSMAVPVRNGWLRLLSAYRLIQCNLMQKVEKMRSQSGSFFCLRFPNRQFECETMSLAGICWAMMVSSLFLKKRVFRKIIITKNLP